MDLFFAQSPALSQILYFWCGIIAFFAILEFITPALVSIWFVFGGLVALIAAICGVSLTLQLCIFLAVSLLLLIFCRPLTKIFLKIQPTATNVAAFIGMKGVVLETINNIRSEGRVKVDGLEFRAKNVTEEVIEADSQIQVERIEGNTLFVKKI